MERIACALVVGSLAAGCGSTPSDGGFDGMPDGFPGTSAQTQGDDTAPGEGTTAQGGTGADGDTGSDGGPAFDVPVPEGEGPCEPGDPSDVGDADEVRSYIWIANTGDNTLTKLNTVTMEEEARYYTREDNAGSPSRTSVALSGRVAVANRYGGVSVFFADHDKCVESNGMPGLQTSSGAEDVLEWDVEECRQWHNRLEPYEVNRPVAWAPGEWDSTKCEWVDEKLWTGGGPGPESWGEVLLLDGDTGAIESRVAIDEFAANPGPYGAAVDGDGNAWILEAESYLYRVDRQTMEYEQFDVPTHQAYGLAVDGQGRPWVCGGGGAAVIDAITNTYQLVEAPNQGLGGCQTDGEGMIWHGRWGEGVMVGIDTETVQVVAELPIPDYVHGLSIDFQGNVWGGDQSGELGVPRRPGNRRRRKLRRSQRGVHLQRHDRALARVGRRLRGGLKAWLRVRRVSPRSAELSLERWYCAVDEHTHLCVDVVPVCKHHAHLCRVAHDALEDRNQRAGSQVVPNDRHREKREPNAGAGGGPHQPAAVGSERTLDDDLSAAA
ncbi:MAG: hypothetical protein AAF721_32645 [Myxococcota bacterium]